jgi:hypothetical protein
MKCPFCFQVLSNLGVGGVLWVCDISPIFNFACGWNFGGIGMKLLRILWHDFSDRRETWNQYQLAMINVFFSLVV